MLPNLELVPYYSLLAFFIYFVAADEYPYILGDLLIFIFRFYDDISGELFFTNPKGEDFILLF